MKFEGCIWFEKEKNTYRYFLYFFLYFLTLSITYLN